MVRPITLLGIILLTLATGCKKKQDACIEARSEYFKVYEAQFRSCSESDYVLWTFSDNPGRRAEGPIVTRSFDTTGFHTVTQTAYSEDGRQTSDISRTVYIGYKYIDSVLVTELSTLGFTIFDDYDTTTADPYIILSGERSVETYENIQPSDLPLVYTFGQYSLRTLNNNSLFLMDENMASNDPQDDEVLRRFESIAPYRDYQNPEVYSNSSVTIEIYWRLGP